MPFRSLRMYSVFLANKRCTIADNRLINRIIFAAWRLPIKAREPTGER